jgi:hypothetical protein
MTPRPVEVSDVNHPEDGSPFELLSGHKTIWSKWADEIKEGRNLRPLRSSSLGRSSAKHSVATGPTPVHGLLNKLLPRRVEATSKGADHRGHPAASGFRRASVVLMFIPGVDMALVTRQVIMHGRRATFATLAELLVGGLTQAVFATIGLSALLLTSATAYTAVKTAGAVYLVALGVQTVWASWRHRCIGSRCHLYGLLLWDTARTVAHQGIVLLASQDQNQE